MRFTILVILLFSFSQIQAQKGIDFFKGSWEEALAEAKSKDKLIFLDAYAVWCGPCKRMAKNVFTDEKVGQFYNANFVNMKIDMEKGNGPKLARKYRVRAYPTLLFIDGSGKLVHQVKGAQQIEAFIKLGKFALTKIDNSAEYAKAYEEGNRDPELVYNYVKALNKAGKPIAKIANEYLRAQKDLTTEQNLKFILEATTAADSRIFDLLIKHKSAIEKITSKQAVKNKIELACIKTAETAVEFKSEDLHKEALKKMKKHYPEKYAQFAIHSEMKFCLACGEGKKYLKACEKYAKKEAKKDPEKLNDLAVAIAQNFPKDPKALKQAEKYAKKATENGNAYNYFFTYANILLQNGKKDKALEMANKSLDLAKGNRGVEGSIKRLIQKIEKS